MMLHRFLGHTQGRAALCGFLLVLGIVMLGPVIRPMDPLLQHIDGRLSAPSAQNPLGTDQFGRDLLIRLMIGGRWSLLGAAVVSAGVTSIGGCLGVAAALGPRWLDKLITQLTQLMQAIPAVLLALVLAALLRPSFSNLIIALVLTSWPWYARMYRALTIQAATAGYVESVRALGASGSHVFVRHLLPGMLGPAMVIVTLNLGSVLLNLSALSFIGLGLPLPTPEWGSLINDARPFFQRVPLLMLAPGACIAFTALCLNLIGNALRDAVDPTTARQA